MPDKQRLLELALKGLQAEQARIEDEIVQIKTELNGGRGVEIGSALESGVRKKRAMSAAARRKISEGMKRRYAALRAAAETPAPRKQTAAVILTPAGRKKLSDMMKARWAAKKKATAKGLKK